DALVAETLFHLVRVLRRIDSVTSKDTRRIPAVEAVLDPLSRADQPGGLAKGKAQRRVLLETLFNIAEERGAIATEQVSRDGRKAGYVMDKTHPEARVMLGEFSKLNGTSHEERPRSDEAAAAPIEAEADGDDDGSASPEAPPATPDGAAKPRRRRGRRGGRG